MSEENPYRPPATADVFTGAKGTLEELVHAWEKLRWLYNGLLLLPGVGILALWIGKLDMPLFGCLLFGFLVALGANLLFFLGPLAELYIRAVFRQGQSIGQGRKLIFGAGIMVSFGVFLLAAMVPLLSSH